MSAETTDPLPIIPETQIIEPIVQCGVLYLGTAPPSPGRRGLDSIQEPFSHRYPVDGTNTARGIDSILSLYDNGIQLTFARQPHAVIFFPISSLIYCASLRFSIVENNQTSSIDWRFVPIDSTRKTSSKHPPLFCAVIQRTQILSGDECHCFITKSDDAALALVRTISEVYANLKTNIKPIRSPIFYQLDRYGRKISETTGLIYLSPATNDDSQIENPDHSVNRQALLDPSLNGFFYRTDVPMIEKWQLWDDDDLIGSRPHPPASPFGQHQGLYHDDLTSEIHRYLRHMDDEEHSSSCSCSSSSVEHDRNRRSRSKTKHHTDRLDTSLTRSHTSAFDPSSLSIQNNMEIKKAPIIIEKVVPNSIKTRRRKYILEQPQQSFNQSIPIQQQTDGNYIPFSDTYQINERGEKITSEGNRIVFMDVIQPNLINDNIEPKPHLTPKSRRKPSRHVPVIDLRSVESLLRDKKSQQRRKSRDHKEQNLEDPHLSTSDMLEIVEGYFEDYRGRKLKLNGHDAQTMLDHLESSNKKLHRRTSHSNEKTHRHHRRSHSTLTAGPGVNYVERPSIQPPPEPAAIEPPPQPGLSVSNTAQVDEYVSNIYGTPERTSQPSSAINHQDTPSSNNTDPMVVTNRNCISAFRYMQSSVNPLLIREYRNVFNGI